MALGAPDRAWHEHGKVSVTKHAGEIAAVSEHIDETVAVKVPETQAAQMLNFLVVMGTKPVRWYRGDSTGRSGVACLPLVKAG